jgi:Gpi18-like mannosyltransferase
VLPPSHRLASRLLFATRRFVGENRYPLTVALSSRFAVYLLVAMVGWTTRRPKGSGFGYDQFAAPLSLWDARWYHWIASFGYDPLVGHGNTTAFFPLFPAVWRGLMILPVPSGLSASLVNSACFVWSVVIIHRVTRVRFGRPLADTTALLLCFFPLSFVFSLPYSESLYLLLTMFAFEALQRGRSVRATAFSAFAIAARPVGVFLIPAIVIANARRGNVRSKAVILPTLVLIGVYVAIVAYLGWTAGDLLANTHSEYRGWNRHLTFPPTFLWQVLVNDVIGAHRLSALLNIGFVGLWSALLVVLWRMRVPIEYVVYSALNVLTPIADGSVLSMGRLGMVAFPLFWAQAAIANRHRNGLLAAAMTTAVLLPAVIYLALASQSYVP